MKTWLIALAFCAATAQAKIVTLQVTLGAGVTQIPVAPFVTARWIAFQSNGARSIRIGDNQVSATRGILLQAAGGSYYNNVSPSPKSVADGTWWYAFGTSGDVLDIVYDDGN